MEKIIYNFDKISDDEIDEYVIRCKAIIINDKNEVLLGFCNDTYQFPGGHSKDDESLEETLSREVKEETGIILKDIPKPFLMIKYYNKNYRDTDKNRVNFIYYYKIKTNEKYDLNNTNYDKYEKDNHYTLKYINLINIDKVLNKTLNKRNLNKIIYKEMIIALLYLD